MYHIIMEKNGRALAATFNHETETIARFLTKKKALAGLRRLHDNILAKTVQTAQWQDGETLVVTDKSEHSDATYTYRVKWSLL